MPVPQIPNPLPGSPGGNYPGFIPNYMYYFKQSATVEQYYQARYLLGFGYGSASVLEVYFIGAHDVNAKDVVSITLAAGTSHADAAEYILNSVVYQQVHPTYHHIIRVCVTGGSSFRPEFVSSTISYGTCCSGGGSGTMSNWILSDGSTTQQIDNAETVTFADSTFVNNVVSATNTVTTSLSASGTPSASTYLRGDNAWAAIPASGCADVYKTITDGSNPFSASGCTDTLTIESPNGSISVNTSTQDTVKLELDKGKYEAMTITLTDENRVMTDGIKYQFRMPYAFSLNNYHTVSSNCGDNITGHVNIAPSGAEEGALQVKVWRSTHTSGAGTWTALTTTNVHIDAGELTSQTAATQPVVGSGNLACGEWLRFEVTQSTGAERGLKINLIGYQTALAPV